MIRWDIVGCACFYVAAAILLIYFGLDLLERKRYLALGLFGWVILGFAISVLLALFNTTFIIT